MEEKNTLCFFDPRKSKAKFYGLIDNEYCRVPASVRKHMSERMASLSFNTSGGRIRFKTDSTRIGIKMEVSDNSGYPHMPLSGYSGLDFFEGDGKNMKYIGTRYPDCGQTKVETEINLSNGLNTVTIYLPLYNGISSLKIGLEKGASICIPSPYSHEKPIVFYGSSITQGGCASRTSNSYCAMLARRFDSDFINLGFCGCALGEEWMAEYISRISMSCFVYDYDHNATDVDYLRKTHLKFIQIILNKQPGLTVILLSKPNPNFSGADFERRGVILDTYEWLISHNYDAYFVDGGLLLGTDGRDCCTVDGIHPNDLGFYRMAEAVSAPLTQLFIQK